MKRTIYLAIMALALASMNTQTADAQFLKKLGKAAEKLGNQVLKQTLAADSAKAANTTEINNAAAKDPISVQKARANAQATTPDKKAEYPGGTKQLVQFLSNNVKYPVVCEEAGVQGRVVVGFIIEKDGQVTSAEVEQSVHPALDKEALRVVSLMPKWSPGIKNGQAIRTKYHLPITFNLPAGQKEKATAATTQLRYKGDQGLYEVRGPVKDVEHEQKHSFTKDGFLVVDDEHENMLETKRDASGRLNYAMIINTGTETYEYNADGSLKRKYYERGSHKIEWLYTYNSNGDCIKETCNYDEPSMFDDSHHQGTDVTEYTILARDNYGNWTKRMDKKGVAEHRTITYYPGSAPSATTVTDPKLYATPKGTGAINIRAKASTTAEKVGQLKAGETLQIVDGTQDWVQVLLNGTQKGWVSLSVVSLTSTPGNAPAITVDDYSLADLHFLGLTGPVRECKQGTGDSQVSYVFSKAGRLISSKNAWGGEEYANPQRDSYGRITRYGDDIPNDMDGEIDYHYVTWKKNAKSYVAEVNFSGPVCDVTTLYHYLDAGKPYLITKQVVKAGEMCENSETTYTYLKFDSKGNWTQRKAVTKTKNEGGKVTTSTDVEVRQISYYE